MELKEKIRADQAAAVKAADHDQKQAERTTKGKGATAKKHEPDGDDE